MADSMEVDISDKSNTNVLNVDTLLVNKKMKIQKHPTLIPTKAAQKKKAKTQSRPSLLF